MRGDDLRPGRHPYAGLDQQDLNAVLLLHAKPGEDLLAESSLCWTDLQELLAVIDAEPGEDQLHCELKLHAVP